MSVEKTYKHILYATDLGPFEKTVSNRAGLVRNQNKSKLSIVHVVESMPVFVDMSGYFNTAEIVEQMEKEATSIMDGIAKNLEIDENDKYLLIGSPKTEIVALAQKIKADLIIIGAHNRHLIDNLIGSTTDAVLRSARCDVLTVRYKKD